MTTRVGRRIAAATCAMLLAASTRESAAQSAGELGAWDGLVLSPVGALAPTAGVTGTLASGVSELSLRTGRWRYDADDAVHDNFGITWTRGVGFARAQVALTGAYELVECPTCSGWVMGGLDVQSTVWNHAFAGAQQIHPAATSIGVRASLGGGRYFGREATTTASAALTVPVDFAFPFGRKWSLCASVLPGFGFGRVTSADLSDGGILPMLGGALAWSDNSRFGVSLGVQRIFIDGGPTQIGAALSLRFGSDHAVRP